MYAEEKQAGISGGRIEMSRDEQREWPRVRDSGTEKRSPTAIFTHPDNFWKSERSVAGPLRRGTARGVGPSGGAGGGNSDMGVDRISPRRFDPLGNYLSRDGAREESPQISRELRNNRRRED
jgi:hypothetical protein